MINRRLLFLLSVIMLSILISCEDDDDNGVNREMNSTYDEDESHKAGQDCMSCHYSGGRGEGWFTVGGTVYNNAGSAIYPNATVKLYTEPNGKGTLVKTIEVDKKGNFYTTTDVNFGSGLYTTVTGTSGNIAEMNSAISNGQCNSCHGSSTEKITAK